MYEQADESYEDEEDAEYDDACDEAALVTTATTTMMTTTKTTIPAIDNPIDALPSLLAAGGSDTAVLLATTAHTTHGHVTSSGVASL